MFLVSFYTVVFTAYFLKETVGSVVTGTACDSFICLNGGTCVLDNSREARCECTNNWNGSNCEEELIYSCFSSESRDLCQSGECIMQMNGTSKCQCWSSWVGRFCERPLNPCLPEINPCLNDGKCYVRDSYPHYLCVCPHGFRGYTCDQDIDECLFHLCGNGATCTDVIGGVVCTCTPGWTGEFCRIDKNECEDNSTCSGRGDCTNTYGNFSCWCEDGFKGRNCEIDVDECASSPCFHGGICFDRSNSFECDCSNTGYHGDMCETEIDECLEMQPCLHQATCVDLINNYHCICHHGYVGHNCSIDVNECSSNPCHHESTCLQRSHSILYGVSPLLNETFSFNNASGFVCGCSKGYEGVFCEVDINECSRFDPCVNGSTCLDQIADYKCECGPGTGGRNCSVDLIACTSNPCGENGVCIPLLINETTNEQGYTCECSSGFTGLHCLQISQFSFNYSFEAEAIFISSSSDPLRISFQFRTTLSQMMIAHLNISNHLMRIFIDTNQVVLSADNVTNELRLTSNATDGDWKRVVVELNTTSVIFQLDDVTSTRARHVVEELNQELPVKVIFGPSYLTHTRYVGCIRDVNINDVTYAVDSDDVVMTGTLGCTRKEMCQKITCQSRGSCVDLWSDFRCDCERPFYGKNCSSEFAAFTFGYLQQTGSHATFNISDLQFDLNNLDFSFFIIFSQNDSEFLTLMNQQNDSLKIRWSNSSFDILQTNQERILSNQVVYIMNKNGSVEEPKSSKINFVLHLNDNEVKVKVGDENHIFDQIVHFESGSSCELVVGSKPEDESNFKGMIQDLRLNNVRLIINESHFEEDPPNSYLIATTSSNLMDGITSDPLCVFHPNGSLRSQSPCQHESLCVTTFNQFVCVCKHGWNGPFCERANFCSLDSCPPELTCEQVSTLNSFNCRGPYTFDGAKPLYSLFSARSDVFEKEGRLDLEMRFRTRKQDSLLVEIHVNYFVLVVRTSTSGHLEVEVDHQCVAESKQLATDGQWHHLSISTSQLEIRLDDVEFSCKQMTVPSFLAPNHIEMLLTVGSFKGCLEDIFINSHYLPLYNTSLFPLPYGYQLPFSSYGFDVKIGSCSGDDVCWRRAKGPCLNNGTCVDDFNDFHCICTPGFTSNRCQTNINDCDEESCFSNGDCVDLVLGFRCECFPGFEGDRCELDIDECEIFSPCLNGATCHNFNGSYQCLCESGFVGRNCSVPHDNKCGFKDDLPVNNTNYPCHNEAECSYNNNTQRFSCDCIEPYRGDVCDTKQDVCANVICHNNGVCLHSRDTFICKCVDGYEGDLCQLVHHCTPTTCFHGGRCVDDATDTFQCLCSPERAGRRCEAFNRCYQDPMVLTIAPDSFCANGGACHVIYQVNESLPTFECSCPDGFVGARCSHVSPCSESACANKGRCVVTWPKAASNNSNIIHRPLVKTFPGFECVCSRGFHGERCEKTPEELSQPLITIATIASGSLLFLLLTVCVILLKTCSEQKTRSSRYHPNEVQDANKLDCKTPEKLPELKPLPPSERLI